MASAFEQIRPTGQNMSPNKPKWRLELPKSLASGELTKIDELAEQASLKLRPGSEGGQVGWAKKFEDAGDELYKVIKNEFPKADMNEIKSYLMSRYQKESPFRSQVIFNIVSKMSSGITFKPRESEILEKKAKETFK